MGLKLTHQSNGQPLWSIGVQWWSLHTDDSETPLSPAGWPAMATPLKRSLFLPQFVHLLSLCKLKSVETRGQNSTQISIPSIQGNNINSPNHMRPSHQPPQPRLPYSFLTTDFHSLELSTALHNLKEYPELLCALLVILVGEPSTDNLKEHLHLDKMNRIKSDPQIKL